MLSVYMFYVTVTTVILQCKRLAPASTPGRIALLTPIVVQKCVNHALELQIMNGESFGTKSPCYYFSHHHFHV